MTETVADQAYTVLLTDSCKLLIDCMQAGLKVAYVIATFKIVSHYPLKKMRTKKRSLLKFI